MPLRLLVRAAPFVLGAVAAAIWLRHRAPGRPALERRPQERPALPERVPSGRFQRVPARPPVDIVTVVDDLLGAAR